MKYSRVFLDSIGYELPPVVVTTAELEERLAPVYEKLRIPQGQLEQMTGIAERRWWESGYPLSRGAAAAGHKALENANLDPSDIDVLILATGAEEYTPTEYLYGSDERVLTQLELEELVYTEDERIDRARSMVMIQCVGCRQ